LAHIVLFEHDRRAMQEVGPDAYVRWMDDQNLGVKSKVAADRAVHMLVESLNRQRLVLNAGKTRILTPKEQADHLCLKHNKLVTAIADRVNAGERSATLNTDFEAMWVAVLAERLGNWPKVAKRLLRIAGLLKSDRVTLDDCKDLLESQPGLAERIFEYLVARDRFADYVELFEWYLDSKNSLYEDVEALWFESLLVADPPSKSWPALRRIALEFVRGSKRGTSLQGPKVAAALTLYWFADRRQQQVFAALLRGSRVLDGPTRRTLAAILCALEPKGVDEWLLLAGRESSSHVSSLIELVMKLRDGESFLIPRRLVFTRRPAVLDRFVFDARSWLRLELLALSPRLDVRNAIDATIKDAQRRRTLARTEARVSDRIAERVGSNASGTKSRSSRSD
jgi:hypothetical protein